MNPQANQEVVRHTTSDLSIGRRGRVGYHVLDAAQDHQGPSTQEQDQLAAYGRRALPRLVWAACQHGVFRGWIHDGPASPQDAYIWADDVILVIQRMRDPDLIPDLRRLAAEPLLRPGCLAALVQMHAPFSKEDLGTMFIEPGLAPKLSQGILGLMSSLPELDRADLYARILYMYPASLTDEDVRHACEALEVIARLRIWESTGRLESQVTQLKELQRGLEREHDNGLNSSEAAKVLAAKPRVAQLLAASQATLEKLNDPSP